MTRPISQIFILKDRRQFFLASESPRRKDLLENMGIPFTILRPKGIEPEALDNEDPVSYVSRAAKAKAHGALPLVSGTNPFLVLSADTIVCLDGKIMGKPKNVEEAFTMLASLSGQTHQVLSCVYLIWNEGEIIRENSFAEVSQVTFYSWTPEILRLYAQSGDSLDKAGAYAIQGKGAFLVKSVNGSWTNVAGLPLSSLIKHLLDLALLVPAL